MRASPVGEKSILLILSVFSLNTLATLKLLTTGSESFISCLTCIHPDVVELSGRDAFISFFKSALACSSAWPKKSSKRFRVSREKMNLQALVKIGAESAALRRERCGQTLLIMHTCHRTLARLWKFLPSPKDGAHSIILLIKTVSLSNYHWFDCDFGWLKSIYLKISSMFCLSRVWWPNSVSTEFYII